MNGTTPTANMKSSKTLRSGCLIGLMLCAFSALAQPAAARERLPSERGRSGPSTLRALEPISRAMRSSIVKIDLDGSTVALGTVVDARGWVITKASEIGKGRLTCWLASGREVPVDRLAVDDDNDVALLRVNAKGLKPVAWAASPAVVGQWVVTPGIAETPQAVGIVSVTPRRILHPRALMGVELDRRSPGARIRAVSDGMGAKEAGLQAGDTIVQLNGLAVGEADELIRKLRDFRDGQTVNLRVKRESNEFTVGVKMKVPSPANGRRSMDQSERMNRMGSEVSERAEGFELALQHDTVLQNWQCGGPLVDLDGRAVGVNIARAGRVASYALPMGLVKPIIDRLKVQAENTTAAPASERN